MTLLLALLLLRLTAVLVGGIAGVLVTAVGCVVEAVGWALRGIWWAMHRLAPRAALLLSALRHTHAPRRRAARSCADSALVRGAAFALAGRRHGR
jgi:hypothetical protein